MYSSKPISYDQVYAKLMKFCAYQERSSFEVSRKAYSLSVNKADLAEHLENLIEEGFVNDERFAETYVKGKLNQKRWGFYKISEGLYSKGIQGELAKKVLDEIPEEKAEENLLYWIKYKKEREVFSRETSPKLFRFLASKGFESDRISKALRAEKLM